MALASGRNGLLFALLLVSVGCVALWVLDVESRTLEGGNTAPSTHSMSDPMPGVLRGGGNAGAVGDAVTVTGSAGRDNGDEDGDEDGTGDGETGGSGEADDGQPGSDGSTSAATSLPTAVRAYYDKYLPPMEYRQGTHRQKPLGPGLHVEAATAPFYADREYERCPLAARLDDTTASFKHKCNPTPPCQARTPPAYAQGTLGAYSTVVPAQVSTGEATVEVLQRAMRAAWGDDPPHVDLYVRAGCRGIDELQQLYPSIELFWPAGIGDVLVVLDEGDQEALTAMRPSNWDSTVHSWRFIYEHVPCMGGRVFNQVSYTTVDLHTSADYVVTIDADCVLHTPVTPDILFTDQGKLLLATTRTFQLGFWHKGVEHFTGKGSYKFHTMVTQPVPFAPKTLSAYRDWVAERNPGSCYYDKVLEFITRKELKLKEYSFCWMCQLGTFLATSKRTLELYQLADIDDKRGAAYIRFGTHVKYEPRALAKVLTYEERARKTVRGGLCRALGKDLIPDCSDEDVKYTADLTFSYSSAKWRQRANAARLRDFVDNFRRALQSR